MLEQVVTAIRRTVRVVNARIAVKVKVYGDLLPVLEGNIEAFF